MATECVISDLISMPFSKKSLPERKYEFIKTGRPCSVIPNLTSVLKKKKKRIYLSF